MTSDALLLQLLEDMPSAALLVTLERKILYANPAAESMLMQSDIELRDRILPLNFEADSLLGATGTLALPNGTESFRLGILTYQRFGTATLCEWYI
ncbi:PAS domain-containing protein [Idiomarina sp.]|uniref:PAS domain-containing protein n=1 Tax=Idiomarina sp. TaxID=1874361 RepID=UPI0025BCB7E1|nr:PAS domain-containing protein [Idiomarina sp.]